MKLILKSLAICILVAILSSPAFGFGEKETILDDTPFRLGTYIFLWEDHVERYTILENNTCYFERINYDGTITLLNTTYKISKSWYVRYNIPIPNVPALEINLSKLGEKNRYICAVMSEYSNGYEYYLTYYKKNKIISLEATKLIDLSEIEDKDDIVENEYATTLNLGVSYVIDSTNDTVVDTWYAYSTKVFFLGKNIKEISLSATISSYSYSSCPFSVIIYDPQSRSVLDAKVSKSGGLILLEAVDIK